MKDPSVDPSAPAACVAWFQEYAAQVWDCAPHSGPECHERYLGWLHAERDKDPMRIEVDCGHDTNDAT